MERSVTTDLLKEKTMQLNPYLSFNGQCEAAFTFYEQCLGGKIEAMMPFKGSPMAAETPPEWHDKIMHASLRVGNAAELMGSDSPPEHYQEPQGCSVSLQFNDLAEAERIFYALAENGTVQMPLQETFWAIRFGMLVDQFGIPWMINCDHPANSAS
ncbi:MAG: VOC family protein [Microcoleaceae cyanobacterium]